MTNTNETMNTTVNTEMVKVPEEMINTESIISKIDAKTVVEAGIAAALIGAAIYVGKKFWDKKIAPKFKKNKKEEAKTEE